MVEILFNTEQSFTPMAKDLLKEVSERVWPGEEKVFLPAPPGPGVIQFGTEGSGILTYSPARLMTVGCGPSVLEQTFRLYNGEFAVPEMKYEVLTDISALAGLAGRVVVDIETKGDIEGQPCDRTILCVGIWDGTDKPVYIIPADLFYAHVAEIAAILSVREIICHNAKFDLGDLNHHLGTKLRAWGDTMVLHYAMHPSGSHGLKEVARHYLGVPDWEADIKKHLKGKDYSTIPFHNLAYYCAFDVFYTGWLLLRLHALATEDQKRFYRQRMIDARFLHDIEEGPGVHVDVEELQRLDVLYQGKIEAVTERLRQLLDNEKFNPGSWQQVQKAFLSRGVVVTKTDVGTLTPLAEDGDILAKMILEHRDLKKLHGTYILGMLKRQRDGWLHPSFKEVATLTGRLASANPNIQQIPRKSPVKKAIDAPEGYVVVSADYSQIEARVMACLSEDPVMMRVFQEGSPDFFDALMPSFFPERFATVQHYLVYEEEECHGDEKEYRAKGKGVIYGLSFGRGAYAIGKAVGLSLTESEKIISNFYKDYSTLYQWREKVKQKATDGTLISLFGMSFEQELVRDLQHEAATERSGLSFMPQHHANQLLLNGARKFHEWLSEQGWGWIHALVHDAVYAYAKTEHAEEVSLKLQECLEESGKAVFGDRVVFAAVPTIGNNWEEV